MAISLIPAATAINGVLPFAQLPTGSVLQVVNYSTNSQFSTTSNTFVTTGFSASITPKFSTSKVLLIVSTSGYTPGTGAEPATTVYRNGSNLVAGFGDIYNSNGAIVGNMSSTYLDSPATTSSTTYTLYVKQGNTGSGAAAIVGVNNTQTSIILMEIAA